MAKIRVLPEHLANRIAAGEVVERPASVVKELLENSLDAGASRIDVEVEGGGTRLIRIIDDGEGMDEDDILLCLERHGTSKIDGDDDLTAIATLGFRGEALPSIASVAKLAITSRQRGRELGTRVVAEYGKLIRVHETGCRTGTTMEVRSLFGNTPARRKFLRTVRTELGHIEEVIKNYALAAPEVTFVLRIDDRETLHLDGGDPPERRLSRIMHYNGTFLKVGPDASAKRPERFVHGFLVPPEAPVAAAAVLRLFVNGRTIRDKMMTHAAAEGMRGFLMHGRNPAGCLHLRLPADEVDVNVHPAKHEVRFRNSRDIHELIVQAVRLAMQDLQQTIRTGIFPPRTADDVIPKAQPLPRPPSFPEPVRYRPQPLVSPSSAGGPPSDTIRDNRNYAQPSAGPSVQTAEPAAEPATGQPGPVARHTAPTMPDDASGNGIQVIGQFLNLYIFCRSGDSLVVIDQHAAHERLLFERLRKQYLSGRVAGQNLLFPVSVELSLFQSKLVEKYGQDLETLGFSIREFGGTTHVIAAVPALAGQCDPGRLFMDVLERFGSETGRIRGAGKLEDILADMACKAAVRSGDAMTPAEIEALLAQMAAADLFSHCPHGRPVIKQIPASEIRKWFYRP